METDDAELDLEEDATMASLPALAAHLQLIAVNDSIISLLLKLHHKLGSDSKLRKDQSPRVSIYRTPQELGQISVPSCRIGDGVHFIGLLLDRFCLSHASVESRVRSIRDGLWPTESVGAAARAATERAEQQQREERRRRAKERQQKLMQEFANQQRSFMKKCSEMLDDEKESGVEKDKDSKPLHADEFECVICNQTSTSTTDRPIAMVVLLQASSVLGHARPADEALLNLPCSDLEILPSILPCRSSRGSYSCQRLDELSRHFPTNSVYHSTNIGWEGGVVVQTCGHYLHVDCHKSYMLSQRSQQQDSGRAQQTLAPDRGEYLCPLCRQLANSVLPIHPSTGQHQAIVQCNSRTHRTVAMETADLMASSPALPSSIFSLMSSFVEDLTNTTCMEYHTLGNRRTTYPFSLIVCSVARTNLEIDLLHHGGRLGGPPQPGGFVAATAAGPPRKSCFLPLFHALGLNLKRAQTGPSQARLWHLLTGLPNEEIETQLMPVMQDVPFLLKDITAVLIELLLSLPLNLDKAHFSCVVRVLYSLAVTQAACRATCRVSREERQELRTRLKDEDSSSFSHLIGTIIRTLDRFSLYTYEEEEQGLDGQSFESYIERSVMPFLRIAAILQAQLFSEQLPGPSDETELDVLANFLTLAQSPRNPVQTTSRPSEHDSTAAGTSSAIVATTTNVLKLVQWACDSELLVRGWCVEFGVFLERHRSAARFLLVEQPLEWRQPYLLRLPRNYSTLFEYYHKRTCTACQHVPQDPSVCLACGTFVCLRETCCRRQETSNFEAVRHSIECGAGTAVFLAVYSTSIVVIRGKRACLWGSVYLDSFGEEDRDLKRGKPLYLSEDRYSLLQHQWVMHSFDHCAHKRWVWHKDNL